MCTAYTVPSLLQTKGSYALTDSIDSPCGGQHGIDQELLRHHIATESNDLCTAKFCKTAISAGDDGKSDERSTMRHTAQSVKQKRPVRAEASSTYMQMLQSTLVSMVGVGFQRQKLSDSTSMKIGDQHAGPNWEATALRSRHLM